MREAVHTTKRPLFTALSTACGLLSAAYKGTQCTSLKGVEILQELFGLISTTIYP